MSIAYHVREFSAKSGNQLRVKVWPVLPNGQQPVEGDWMKDPDHIDMKEFDEWFRRTIARDSRTDLPLRVDFAGGWLDVPRFAMEGACIVNMAISPLVTLTSRANDGTLLFGERRMVWVNPTAEVQESVPCGSGLGTSAAWHMLNGRDADREEENQGCGWQDAAIIREGGLCVWSSGPKPHLFLRSTGAWLAGKLAIMWAGKSHGTSEAVMRPRDYDGIANASTLAAAAVESEDLDTLADAINQTYELQLAEGMDELPLMQPAGVRNIGIASKYCGAGWGGFGVYLFETRELRDAAVLAHGVMPVEPYAL